MAHASTQPGPYSHGHEGLFSPRQKIPATDFTTAREIWREGVTILKAIKSPPTRSGFSLLLMDRSEACLAKTQERWRKRARINPAWPLVFIILFLLALFSLRAAETFKTSDCLDRHLDPTTTRKVDGKIVSVIFPTNAFAKSVHSQLDCVDCH